MENVIRTAKEIDDQISRIISMENLIFIQFHEIDRVNAIEKNEKRYERKKDTKGDEKIDARNT